MSSRRFLLAAPAVLVATVVAAGCGSTGISEPVATTKVSMAKSYRFDPKAIEIKAGDAVTWTNNDNFTHTVKVDGQEDHKVGRGDSVSITFDNPGSYHYVCTLHSKDMDGTVIVTCRSPSYAPTSSSSPARSARASTAPSSETTSRKAREPGSASSSRPSYSPSSPSS